MFRGGCECYDPVSKTPSVRTGRHSASIPFEIISFSRTVVLCAEEVLERADGNHWEDIPTCVCVCFGIACFSLSM